MKVTLTPTGATPFLLADDTISVIAGTSWPTGAGGTYKDGDVSSETCLVQKTPLFRAAYQFVAPRYNIVESWWIIVERQFSNTANCLAFCKYHRGLIPRYGEIMETDSSNGTVTAYNPLAFLDKAAMEEFSGAYCRWRYDFTLNGPWQSSS